MTRRPFPLALPLLFLATTTGCVVGGGERDLTFDEDLSRVELRLENGEITVYSSAEFEQVHLYMEGGGLGATGFFDTEIEDGVLMVDGDCDGMCGGEIMLEVPAGLEIDAALRRGELFVELEEPASVKACTSTGSVDLLVPEGGYQLELEVGVGELYTDGVWDDPESELILASNVGMGELYVSAW